MYPVKRYILLMMLTLYLRSIADTHEELTHLVAHAGAGYAVTLVSDQIYNKIGNLTPTSSLILGVGTAFLAGSLYKMAETGNTSNLTGGALYNGIGAVGAVGTIMVFHLNIGW
jgi:hypothetical protein